MGNKLARSCGWIVLGWLVIGTALAVLLAMIAYGTGADPRIESIGPTAGFFIGIGLAWWRVWSRPDKVEEK